MVRGAASQKKPIRSEGKRIHDAKGARITLKQWRIFHAVHDFGGFTEAGERLHLTQSTISYAIARMQEQLGVTLFESIGRCVTITPAGRALLTHSRYLLREANELEGLARRYAEDAKESVQLLVETAFPPSVLGPAIDALRTGTPPVCPDIEIIGRGTLAARLATSSSLAICSAIPDGFVGEPLTAVRYTRVRLALRADPDGQGESKGWQAFPPPRTRSGTADAITSVDPHCVGGTPETAMLLLQSGCESAWVPALALGRAPTTGHSYLQPVPGSPPYFKHFYLVRSAKLTHCTAPVRAASILKMHFGRHAGSG